MGGANTHDSTRHGDAMPVNEEHVLYLSQLPQTLRAMAEDPRGLFKTLLRPSLTGQSLPQLAARRQWPRVSWAPLVEGQQFSGRGVPLVNQDEARQLWRLAHEAKE